MNWNCTLPLLLALVITQALVSAQDNDDIESTTAIDEVLTEAPATEENRILLDSKLRSALLEALSEIENEEDDEQTISKAQASAVTIIKNEDDDNQSVVSSEDTSSEDIQTNDVTPTTTPPSSTQKATQILFQKSEAVQTKSITSLENTPLDAFKDAEQIITSASNSFLTGNNDEHKEPIETRSIPNRESVLENEQYNFQANTKTSSFPTLNTISNNESKKPSRVVVEKFSFGKAVDSPVFVRTSYKTSTSSKVTNSNANNLKTTVSSNSNTFANPDNNEVKKEVEEETITQSTPEVSTEENEAKVEQVQFFSAPLVAAFTVHQDEAGQPKKVEPIYKNGLGTKKEKVATVQQQPIINPQPTQTLLQSSSFNSLSLQEKQQILQQELEKLRGQQQNLQSRNNFANIQSFNSIESNNIGFTQNGFRQAINQNFNHLDPVFTEPDRSVVTKLATIDPSNLSQNSDLFLNRFTANEAIVPRVTLPLQNNNFNQIPQTNKPIQTSFKSQNEVSLIPSITLDPLTEAGKLPKNAQILPNKEPTGFNTIPKLQQQNFNLVQQNNNNFANQQQFIQNLPNKEPTGFNKQIQPNFLQSNINSFARPQQPIQTPSFVQNNNFNVKNNNQFANQNRIFRQEQGTGNFGLNHQQNTFSIVPSQQPFQPKLELSYFPDNRFLRQNDAALAQPQQNFVSQASQSTRYQGFNDFPTQHTQSNNNRFFRSNLEGTLQSPQSINVQQSIQPFNNIPQNSRYYRSNQEGSLTSPQNFGFNAQAQNIRILRSNQENAYLNQQNGYYQTPLLQNYRYSQSFGIPTH